MSSVISPQSSPMPAMNPIKPVKTAKPTRARKGRAFDTFLGHLPQRRAPSDPAARPRPWSAGASGPGRRQFPDPSRRGRGDPHTGPCRRARLRRNREGHHPSVDQSVPHGPGKALFRRGTGPVGTARSSRRGGRPAAGQTASRLHRRRGGCAHSRGRQCAGRPSDLPRRPSRPAAPTRQQARALRDLPAPRRADACHVVCEAPATNWRQRWRTWRSLSS